MDPIDFQGATLLMLPYIMQMSTNLNNGNGYYGTITMGTCSSYDEMTMLQWQQHRSLLLSFGRHNYLQWRTNSTKLDFYRGSGP